MTYPPKRNDYKIIKDYDSKHLDNIIDKSIKSFSSQVVIYKNNKKILDINNKNK